MDGFERRKAAKVKQVFSACFELVIKNGFDNVRVDEVARSAHVSPATIYNYFGTKEELFQQTSNHWITAKLNDYEQILQTTFTFEKKVKLLMIAEAKNINTLAVLSQGDPESVHYFLYKVEAKIEAFYLKLIEQGKADGYIAAVYSEKI